MATGQVTSEPAAVATAGDGAAAGRSSSARYEIAAYVALAAALAILMWLRVREADGFYLDEWLYTHAGRWIVANLPGGLWEAMPYWTRGPQRLYPALIGVPYSLFGTSTAYDLAHALNVVLLASSVWPAALLARRMISSPWLRVLAVALAVATPWLMIANHLLAENLALPLFLWTCVAIVRVTESPAIGNQVLVIVALVALTLTRINLGVLFAALVLVVVVREGMVAGQKQGMPWRRRLAEGARTQWLLLAAFAVALACGVYLLGGGTSTLGDYGRTATPGGIWDRLTGDAADATRRSGMAFVRSLVNGMYVFPFALGVGAALAGATGRLGRRLIVPGLLTLVSVPLVIGGVVLAASAQEERYVFYPATLIALFAVVALEHLRRLRGWVAGGAVLTVWALLTGPAQPGTTSFDFFHAPAGAFWTRVLDARLKRLEGDLLGWSLLPRTGWLLFGAGLVAMVALLRLAPRHGRLVRTLLAGGLAVCALMQVVTMQYGFKQELHGTTSMPGGLAGPAGHDERPTFVDAAVPDGASALLQPALARPDSPIAESEYVGFWSKAIDTVVAMPWNGAGVPATAGMTVLTTSVAPDGLARWTGTRPRWLVAAPDDPRLQFDAKLVRRSDLMAYAVWRLGRSGRARWTADGLSAEGLLPEDRAARLTLDTRSGAFSAVRLTLTPAGAQPAAFVITHGDRRVARGRLQPGTTRTVVLRTRGGAGGEAGWLATGSGGARIVAARLKR